MLDFAKVDLSMLTVALEDHEPESRWFIDPATGEVAMWAPDLDSDLDEMGERGYLFIEPIPSSEAYEDLVDFTKRVQDARAQDLLERAIAGRGAFRRFKDTLFEFPELRQEWFDLHDRRMERRAIEWLRDHELIPDDVAGRELVARDDPPLPERSEPFDARMIASATAWDLRRIYRSRLVDVVLFGSWARGDAHPESDIDLLIVLDTIDDRSIERRRIDEILWQHSFSNDTVVSAVLVSREQVEQLSSPLLETARREGVPLP